MMKIIKNKKKSNIYNIKQKRTSFVKIFLKNAVTGLLLTFIFAGLLFVGGEEYIFSQTEKALFFTTSQMNNIISKGKDKKDNYIEWWDIKVGASYAIPLGYNNEVNSYYTENCTALIAMFDEKNDIICSSRKNLMTVIRLNNDEKELFLCDIESLNIPELEKFEDDYYSLENRFINNHYIYREFIMKSAYIDTKNKRFIPHELTMNIVKDELDKENETVIDSKDYSINIDIRDYELIELDVSDISGNKKIPKASICNFYGTDKYDFDALMQDERLIDIIDSPPTINGSSFFAKNDTTRVYYAISNIWYNGSLKKLLIAFKIDAWNSVTKLLYFKTVILFLIVVLFLEFLHSWILNVKKQAEYAFEDYQRALTNNLAHDIKTPLMAIGGYVENILDGKLSDEEVNKYLKSIMNNVSYTDSIISRTLELNSMNYINIHKKQTDVRNIVENIIDKYSVMLDSNNITLNIDGHSEVDADASMLETAIENLISNAVKYTPDNGNININISKKGFSISNTVSKKFDVSGIKRPFVKSDTARNKSGSGLGLSIADTAVQANNFNLVLLCTDTQFIAEIRF